MKNNIKLMTHVVIGYPSLETTIEIVKTMVSSGVDMVELQIPFSDPMADGPTIMKACEKALRNGTKVSDAFNVVKNLRKTVSIPLYFMCYYNTVFQYPSTLLNTGGVEKFCMDAKSVGITGLIVPDMPIEEEKSEHLFSAMVKYNLDNIRVVSPASTNERLKLNAKYASSFVYATARQGITGAKEELDSNIKDFLKRVRGSFKIPIACGFGISKKEHIQSLQGFANIAIIGSAIIDVINKSSKETVLENVSNFIKDLRMVE